MQRVTDKKTKKVRVREYVASRGWTLLGETEWHELRSALADISESTVRAAGIPIAQPWLGVVQHSFEDLQQSLSELSAVYAVRPDLRRYCRDQVIVAKSRARRGSRSEMVEWMLVWLDDPSMFEAWAEIRRKRAGSAG